MPKKAPKPKSIPKQKANKKTMTPVHTIRVGPGTVLERPGGRIVHLKEGALIRTKHPLKKRKK